MALEYVSGPEFVFANDSIVVSVLNTGGLAASARILINHESGGTSVAVVDTGTTSLNPGASFGFSVSMLASGFYWIQIFVSSNEVVSSAQFVRLQGTEIVIVASYTPGSFATFDRKRV